MDFLKHLNDRNLIHNSTPELTTYLNQAKKEDSPPSVYCGFDPSGESLQVGNLLALMMLRRAQIHGLKPIALLGGATGLIGDPSGKKAERTLLDKNKAEENLYKIKNQIANLIDTEGPLGLEFVNNLDWFKNFHFIDFLRDVGKHITVNYMLAKDSVKLRMETGISYAEFGYMLMQGYDFLHLFETKGCRIQLGGSDQWGNITTGLELIRRKHQETAHALSTPLLTDQNGNKLGKTEGGAIYLSPELTSPYQFYQFFLNTPDTQVLKLAEALTLFEQNQLNELQDHLSKNPEKREAQKILAQAITNNIHGSTITQTVIEASNLLFSKSPEAFTNTNPSAIKALAKELPSCLFSEVENKTLLEALVHVGLAPSKSEARRLIQSGGVSINRIKQTDEKMPLNRQLINNTPLLFIGVGKQKMFLILKDDL